MDKQTKEKIITLRLQMWKEIDAILIRVEQKIKEIEYENNKTK